MKCQMANGLLACIIFAFCVLSSYGSARAQLTSPFRITGTRGFVGFGWEREDETREESGNGFGDDIEDVDSEIFEEIGFGIDGFVYHPRLLDFRADVDAVFKQVDFTTNRRSIPDQDENYINYDVFARILKEHRLSFWLGSTQQRQDINTPFFDTSRITTTQYTAGFTYLHPVIPVWSGYSHETSDGEGSVQRDEERDKFYIEAKNEGSLGDSILRYEKEERTDDFSNVDLKIDALDFINVFPFGSDGRHALRSQLRYQDQRGTSPIETTYIDETLDFRHSDRLRSYAGFSHYDSDFENQTTNQERYRAGLEHHLYDSLVTTLEGRAENYEIDDGFNDSYAGDLGLNYRKRLPIGSLDLRYRGVIRREDEDFSRNVTSVFLEQHTFGELIPDVIVLNRDLVVPDSIELVDGSGVPLVDPGLNPVTEGIHYQIEVVGTVTRIRLILPAGGFLSGQTVFVNYDFGSRPPIEFTSYEQFYGATLNIKDIWRAYYAGGRINQVLRDGVDFGNRLDDIRDRTYGMEVDYGMSRSKAERKQHRSRRNPFETDFLSQEFQVHLWPNADLFLTGTYIDTVTFEDVDRTIDRIASARLAIFFPKLRWAQWDIETTYANRDVINEDQESIQLRSEFFWRYKRIDFTVTYEYWDLDRELFGDEDSQYFFVRLRRFFGTQDRRARR